MTWSYRLMHRFFPEIDEHQYGIHEVYYDSDGTPEMVTEDAIAPYGETLEELKSDLVMYLAALAKPVLEYDEIGQ